MLPAFCRYDRVILSHLQVLLKREYPREYTSDVSTRVSNALLVGEIFGQVVIGLTCDYLGRKFAIISTTALIVIGGVLATASHGITIDGMFWMLTVSRGIVGFGAGGMFYSSSCCLYSLANTSQGSIPLLQHQLQKLPMNTP